MVRIARVFTIFSSIKRKRNPIILSCFILLLLLGALFFVNSSPNGAEISGTIYIDSHQAPREVDVKIVFPDGEVFDPDGTDDQGRYCIDVSGFIDAVGMFFISYNGAVYIARNSTGDFFNVTIIDSTDMVSIDLFVYISENDLFDPESPFKNDTYNDSRDDNADSSALKNDTISDETNETDGGISGEGDDTEAQNDDNATDNQNDYVDNTSDEGDNTKNDDTTGGNKTTDDSSDNDQDDHENDEESDSCVRVEISVWNNTSRTWDKEVFMNRSGIVRFRILIEYNGSYFLKNISITDQLSAGLTYTGNATINGALSEPFIDLMNRSLSWEFTNVSSEEILISYSCMIHETGLHINKVTVYATESISRILTDDDTVTVKGYGDLNITQRIWDSIAHNWVNEYSVDIGMTIRFQITIAYHGSFSVKQLTLSDIFPVGLEYSGNTTVNSIAMEPMNNAMNHMVQWNLSDLQSNQTAYIEFEVNITENTTCINTVRVTGVESIGKQFNTTASARVIGIRSEQIFCIKQVRIGNNNWSHDIDAFVGNVNSFNITLGNNGQQSFYNINIVDNLPLSLTYVPNSSIITFKNKTFFAEPIKDPGNTMLLWLNINSVIQDYLSPGEQVSLFFDTMVNTKGLVVNSVHVTSTICHECDPLEITDTAFINATIPISELLVDVGGPYLQKPMVPVVLTVTATGGESPYVYSWDLDNDSIFDDGYTKSLMIQWDTIGMYPIAVKVIDTKGTIAVNTASVNISIPPLIVNAYGPYVAFVGDVLSFHAEATGGIFNYTWLWDFDDGNTSTIQSPSHVYVTAGIYTATVIVTDQENHSKNASATVTIHERDTVPPRIDMEHPHDAIYVKNKPIFPFFTPLIFGEIYINISVTDEDSAVERIEMHINENLIGVWYNSSVQWVWSDRTIGRYRLYVVAYDTAGNWNVLEKYVWKIL